MTDIQAAACFLTGFHNPQGRALAVGWLLADGPEDLLFVTARPLVATLRDRLQRFVLRARSARGCLERTARCRGLAGLGIAAALAAMDSRPRPSRLAARRAPRARRRTAARRPRRSPRCHDAAGPRCLVLRAPPALLEALAGAGVGDDSDWHAADVAGGRPAVLPATSEAFVAQMLNLDVLDGISFRKGCYTGQEVIARAHYRGRVKRRMQRLRTLAAQAQPLAPGARGRPGDGRAFEVVDAVQPADGRCEFLAVTARRVPCAATIPASGRRTAAPTPGPAGSAALLYALPD
ncbi:MAG: tRNA-modifying protein YgfZ [Steroidobacteraceae bacterium]